MVAGAVEQRIEADERRMASWSGARSLIQCSTDTGTGFVAQDTECCSGLRGVAGPALRPGPALAPFPWCNSSRSA